MLFSVWFRGLSAGRKTALVAMFIAVSVVANCFSIDVGASNKIAFTYVVCFFAGYLLGGLPAFFIALLGDALGYLFNPVGVYWLFGVTLALYALFVGAVMNMPVGAGKRAALCCKAAAALLLGYVLFTVLLNTAVNYWYVLLFVWEGVAKKTFWLYFAGRISFQTVVYAVNFAVCLALLPVFSHLLRAKSDEKKVCPHNKDGERA